MIYKSDLLILFSGGADSRLLVEMAMEFNKSPYCLFIDYGQLIKEKEIEKMEFTCKKYNLPYQIVKVDGLNIESGLTGNGKKSIYENVNPMYVPFRNTIFLSIAASVAENNDINKIWFGPDWSDNIGNFPDCKQEYVNKYNELLKLGGSKDITIEAPLLGFTKENIIKTLTQIYDVDESEYFSGYGDL